MEISYVEWRGAGTYHTRQGQYWQRSDDVMVAEFDAMGFEPEEFYNYDKRPTHLLSRWVLDSLDPEDRAKRLSRLLDFTLELFEAAGYEGLPTNIQSEVVVFEGLGVAHFLLSRRILIEPKDDWGAPKNPFRRLTDAVRTLQQRKQRVYLSTAYPRLVLDFEEYAF